MKTSIQIVLMLLGVYVFTGLSAQEDKSLSPYFFVYSDNPEEDQLPLKSTSAEVNISGVIADVIVKQVYTNEGSFGV